MTLKIGDIVEITDTCKNYFYGHYGIRHNMLFKVTELTSDRIKVIKFPENMYNFYFSLEEIKLYKQEDIKEEDVL